MLLARESRLGPPGALLSCTTNGHAYEAECFKTYYTDRVINHSMLMPFLLPNTRQPWRIVASFKLFPPDTAGVASMFLPQVPVRRSVSSVGFCLGRQNFKRKKK